MEINGVNSSEETVDLKKLQQEFEDIFNEKIKRDGAKELLAWLKTTDFLKFKI